MPGLEPGMKDQPALSKWPWIAGSSPAMTNVEGRDAHAADEASRREGSALGWTRPARSNSVALSTVTGRLK